MKKCERAGGVKYDPPGELSEKVKNGPKRSKMVQKVVFSAYIVWKLNSEWFRPKKRHSRTKTSDLVGVVFDPPALNRLWGSNLGVKGVEKIGKKFQCVKWYFRNC